MKMTMNMNPEQLARQNIDKQLQAAGWVVQKYKEYNPSAGQGIAVAEYPTDSGPADYILFINRKPVGVIEAKPAGTILTPVEEQAERYATSSLKWFVEKVPLRFIYQSTGDETRFTDINDPAPRARSIFTFQKVDTLARWLSEEKNPPCQIFRYTASPHGRVKRLPIPSHFKS